RRMRRPDEMHDRIGPGHRRCERGCIERVADGRGHAGGRTAERLGTSECTDVVAAREQRGDQPATDVAGAPCNEYVSLDSRDTTSNLSIFRSPARLVARWQASS